MKTALKNRSGLSLVELLVAMALLGIMLTSVAGLTFEAARRSIYTSQEQFRQSEVTREINRLTALPFSSLPTSTQCRTVMAAPFPNTTCVSSTTVPPFSRRFTVIVRPTRAGIPPDTVEFTRSNPPTVNPLNN